MPMTYTALLAAKGTSGSIANWAGYSKLDLPVVLEEAQYLIYEMLRVREMRTEWTFGMLVGQSSISLPARYLDPLGPCYDVTNGGRIEHIINGDLLDQRNYEPVTGALPSNPFTTTAGSSSVNVNDPAHGLTNGSTITFANGTAVDVFSPNATYPVTAIVDANNFTIDMDTQAATSAVGGGTGGTWAANRLISGTPAWFTIGETRLRFDVALDTPTTYKHQYYRRPLLLSATNPNNFLTDRYPKLLRVATQASAADFMRDDTEFQKQVQILGALVQSTVANDDLSYRGAMFGTDTP